MLALLTLPLQGGAAPASKAKTGPEAQGEGVGARKEAMSRNRYRKPKERLVVPRSNQPPKFATFTPPAVYRVPVPPADIEQLLQIEQKQVHRIINDAETMLAAGSSEPSKAALRERAEKLSPSARITARVLTRLRLDSRYPPKRS